MLLPFTSDLQGLCAVSLSYSVLLEKRKDNAIKLSAHAVQLCVPYGMYAPYGSNTENALLFCLQLQLQCWLALWDD